MALLCWTRTTVPFPPFLDTISYMEEEDVIGTTAETDRTNTKKVGGPTLIGAPKYTWNVRYAGTARHW